MNEFYIQKSALTATASFETGSNPHSIALTWKNTGHQYNIIFTKRSIVFKWSFEINNMYIMKL